jgi:hypothetical protein
MFVHAMMMIDHNDCFIITQDIVSPKSSAKTGKNKGQAGDSGGSKRKRAQEAEETPQPKKNKILKGNLVGSRIKVWWPDDRKFYKGVVESFDVASKKHKVVYDDGDVERLHLKNEKWEFIDEVCPCSLTPLSILSSHFLIHLLPAGARQQS